VPVSAAVRSECAACKTRTEFTVDSEFRSRIDSGPASPLIFQPSIDWNSFRAPTIVNDY
jgi:hypothetical protein